LVDKVSQRKRSEIMSKIRSRDTKPELELKSIMDMLPTAGDTLYHPKMPFKPDFAVPKNRIVIFVDGDFFHGRDRVPFVSGTFWIKKILRNMERDEEANMFYCRRGWCVIRIWESALKNAGLAPYLWVMLQQRNLIPGVRRIG
jgi:DNA mismatch endonuclease (patch repair protein)